MYIPLVKMKTRKKFHPIDKNGNKLEDVRCCFHGQGTCKIEMKDRRYPSYSDQWEEANPFKPKVKYHKGAKKRGVNPRLVKSLRETVKEESNRIDEIVEEIQVRLDKFKEELKTPFVPENIRDFALESVDKQLQDMKLRRMDLDRLKSKITA